MAPAIKSFRLRTACMMRAIQKRSRARVSHVCSEGGRAKGRGRRASRLRNDGRVKGERKRRSRKSRKRDKEPQIRAGVYAAGRLEPYRKGIRFYFWPCPLPPPRTLPLLRARRAGGATVLLRTCTRIEPRARRGAARRGAAWRGAARA